MRHIFKNKFFFSILISAWSNMLHAGTCSSDLRSDLRSVVYFNNVGALDEEDRARTYIEELRSFHTPGAEKLAMELERERVAPETLVVANEGYDFEAARRRASSHSETLRSIDNFKEAQEELQRLHDFLYGELANQCFQDPEKQKRAEIFSSTSLNLQLSTQRLWKNGEVEAAGLLSQRHKEMLLSFIVVGTRMTIGFIPVVGEAADMAEALTGKDLLTGETLSPGIRMLSALAALIPFADRTTIATIGKHTGDIMASAAAKISKSTVRLDKLGAVTKFLRRSTIPSRHHEKILGAFAENARVSVISGDMKVYRYFVPGKTQPRGAWVTIRKLSNPAEDLALPIVGKYELKEWILPRGTTVLEGEVAPFMGKAGGAHQIFLENPEVLKEL